MNYSSFILAFFEIYDIVLSSKVVLSKSEWILEDKSKKGKK